MPFTFMIFAITVNLPKFISVNDKSIKIDLCKLDLKLKLRNLIAAKNVYLGSQY